MPSFCRHNRLIQNCPICSREQEVELRPVVSSSAPKAGQERPPRVAASGRGGSSTRSSGRSGGGTVRVRRLARGADDGYRSALVPGLRSSVDAEALAHELAFATTRLTVLEADPPGLYAAVAAGDGIEERTWLAFQIAYLGPLSDGDPFRTISAVRTLWASGENPVLDGAELGPRTAHVPARGTVTLDAYRAWAGRSGSQAAAFTGEESWTAERRFARVFERLALPGLHRGARFELLVSLGRLGVYELRAGALQFGGDNEVTIAAKRALGIGDALLLERRASELAGACHVSLDALDQALHNWNAAPADRAGLGLPLDTEPDPDVLAVVRDGLGLS